MAAPKLPEPSMIPETVERAFLFPLMAGFFPYKENLYLLIILFKSTKSAAIAEEMILKGPPRKNPQKNIKT